MRNRYRAFKSSAVRKQFEPFISYYQLAFSLACSLVGCQVAGILDALNADKGEDLGADAWKELLTGPNVKALTIGTGLVFFQQVRPPSRPAFSSPRCK